MFEGGLVLAFLIAVWVGQDARKRYVSSVRPFLWFLATFALVIVFWPLYLFVRPPKLKRWK